MILTVLITFIFFYCFCYIFLNKCKKKDRASVQVQIKKVSNWKMDNEIHSISSSISPFIAVGSCLFLSILYVASLYVWSSNPEHNRDHPSTVKKRFCSVFVVMLISSIFVYLFTSKDLLEKITILEIMGFRRNGILPAIIVPLFLTSVLFLGPLCVQAINGAWKTYIVASYWIESFQNILWIRNHIVAPLSEEFTFRACMQPLLLQSFAPIKSVFITPLFFGVAHFHHISERLKMGMELKNVLIISCFQFTYTTIFGFYSAYLFARTGHFIAPFLAHALCNHMGFPDIQELLQQTGYRKIILMAAYVIGLISWIILLPICTNPIWFSNNLYWNS